MHVRVVVTLFGVIASHNIHKPVTVRNRVACRTTAKSTDAFIVILFVVNQETTELTAFISIYIYSRVTSAYVTDKCPLSYYL